MGALAILLSFVVCSIAVRAVGETDINPSGPMAKITQMVYGFLDPGQVTTNLMAAGITKAGASQAADLMLDLKAGYLLKASIRRQVFAQLIGVLAGVFAVAAVYQALMAAYQIPGKEFTGPAVQAWRAMAKILSEGFATMPAGAGLAALAAGALGILLTLATRVKRIAPYLPSPVALGIALLIPGYYAVAIWLAALLVWAWKRRRPEQMANYSSSIASGLIAGEAITMVVVAVLLIAGASWV
jgi:OPT family oligopeptide transporter